MTLPLLFLVLPVLAVVAALALAHEVRRDGYGRRPPPRGPDWWHGTRLP